jgi:translation initiation factor IF-3
LKYAQERDLDLVEVAGDARPPVCRVLDYSKYKYEQAQKAKSAKKHQTQITIREIKLRPKIATHDYDTKKGHVERFLLHKDKVKVTIMFRGREVTHPERGQMILERLAEELEPIAQVDQRPQQDGRNMTMLLSPSKAVIAGQIDAESWKTRDDIDPDAEDEGITVDGPGEEPSPAREPVEPAPRRTRTPKTPKPEAEAVADAEVEAAAEPVADEVVATEAEPESEVEVDEAPVSEAEPVAEAPAPEAEVAPEPEPEPEPVVEEPKPKPKKAGPAPVSKAEAARKRTPKPKLNLGTGAANPLVKKEDDEKEEEAEAEAAPAKKPRKAPAKAAAKAPTKAAAAAAVAAAKKSPAAAKAAADKPATTDEASKDA